MMANPQNNNPKGKILKEAREAQGIALETVHEMTKIPMDVLRAIEEGYTVRSISPFYMKGFVKMYAQYLGVPVEQVVEEYHREKLPPASPVTIRPRGNDWVLQAGRFFTKRRQQTLVKAGLALLLLLGFMKIVGAIFHHKKNQPKIVAHNVQAPVARSEKKGKQPGGGEKKTSGIKDVSKEAAPAVPREEKKPLPTPVPMSVDNEEGEASRPKKPAEKKINLTVKAQKKGWLQVKVDGNLIFQSVLDEGASESWQAKDSIELSGKNIHNLVFELNGKVLGGLGRADRSARRVIVTQNGLSVKQ